MKKVAIIGGGTAGCAQLTSLVFKATGKFIFLKVEMN